MKTANSIPDKIFEAAECTAKKLGLSRSEFYANAVRESVEHYRTEGVLEKLNEVYVDASDTSDTSPTKERLDPVLAELQQLSVSREEW